MTFSLIMLAAMAATHTISIPHDGSSIDAAYSARAEIRTQTIGAYTPNRTDTRRCLWTATLVVERQLGGHPAASRIISSDRELKGSRSGTCSETKRNSIKQEVLSRESLIRDHLLAVARQDHAPLLAELSAVRPVGTR